MERRIGTFFLNLQKEDHSIMGRTLVALALLLLLSALGLMGLDAIRPATNARGWALILAGSSGALSILQAIRANLPDRRSGQPR